jgi:predicted metal-dependent hydrolase
MKGDDPIKSLRMADRRVPVVVRRNARARRISIRVDTANDSIVLTLPARGSLREGLRFMAEKTTWIERRVADLPPRVPFEGPSSRFMAGTGWSGMAPCTAGWSS